MDNFHTKRKNNDENFKFKNIAKNINMYLKEENIQISFKGYDETIYNYFSINDYDLSDIHNLIIECNLWSNYISELNSFISYKKSMYEINLDYSKAFYDKKNPDEQLTKQIKYLTKKIKLFSLFTKQLQAQNKFFIGAYYHCKQIYNLGMNTISKY